MFLDKKGDSETIVALFAFVIVAAILFFYGPTLIDVLTGRTDSSNCNTWVSIQSKSKIAGIVAIPRDSPCITEINTLTDKKENEFYDYMAKSAFSCWDMYGRGEVDFFSDWDLNGVETYCFVCDETAIGGNVDITNFDMDKFEVYLSNNHPSGNKNSYTDIFTGTENSRIDFGEGNIPLKKGDKLYTMFTLVKSTEAPDFLTGTVDTFASIGTKVLTTIGIQAITAKTVTGSLKGAGIVKGLKGTIGLSLLYTAIESEVKAEYIYPSIIIAKGDEIVKNGESICSQVHYKPKKELISKENLT